MRVRSSSVDPSVQSRLRKRSRAERSSAPAGRRPVSDSAATTGARILSRLADPSVDIGDIAIDLLRLAMTHSDARACGLFRAVQDTGLLVPLGTAAIDDISDPESVTTVMARAADQAATVCTDVSFGPINPAPFRRRTTAPGGLVLWSTCISGAPLEGATKETSPEPSGPLSSAFSSQVLGVWVLALQNGGNADDFSKEPAARSSAHALREAVEQIHPLFQLLLQQVTMREAVNTAKRQTEKRLREVAAIYEVGRAIDAIDIPDLLDLITRKAADVMEAQACSLMLMDEKGRLEITASFGLPDDVVENTKVLIGEGIAGRVALTGEALMVQSDARSDPRFKGSRNVGLPGISSSITMPMFSEDRQANGVLCIRRRTPSAPFTEDDKRLFSIFATQAAIAIKNARLYRDLRSRVQELSTLSALTETISSNLDLDFVLDQVADSLIQLGSFDRCLLYLRENAEDSLEERFTVKVSRGFGRLSEELLGSDEFIRDVTQRLSPIWMNEGDPSFDQAVRYARSMGLSSFYAQPVVVRGSAIGVLVVSNDLSGRPMADSNLDLLSTFLQHAGIAIDNARLYAQMERRVRELHTLFTVSQSLTTTYGLNRVCATVAGAAKDMVHADSALLMLFNDRLDGLRVREAQGLPDKLYESLRLLPDADDVSQEARALREPFHCPDHSCEDFNLMFGTRWRDFMDSIASAYPSLTLVPLVTEDTAVGFLLLGKRARTPFRLDEIKLVSIVSSQAGALLRGAALYEQSVEQRVLELSALYELSKKVRTAHSLSGALDAILDIVSSVIWCDVAEIFTVHRQNERLVRQVSRGETRGGGQFGIAEATIPSWVTRERKALLIADVTKDERFAGSIAEDTACKSLMAIPIFLGDEVLAVLQVQAAASGLYTEDSVKMLSLIAAQAAALFRDMESLRELTTYTDSILRSIAAAVVTLDAKGRVVTLNFAAERMLRIGFAELNGQPFESLLERLDGVRADVEDIRKMVALSVQTRQIVQRHRLRIFSEDSRVGSEAVIVNGSASQLLSERGEYLGVVLVFEDITKEDEMEQELGRMSRLAEIGQLAAGIAHELRNPLASIKGAAQVLLGDLTKEMVERHGEFLDIIVREVDGLNSVTTEFLEFSRPTPPSIGAVSVNDILERRAGFMNAELDQLSVRISLDLDPELPSIQADRSQLERVFLNIILNSVQAMPDGGELQIRTTRLGSAKDSKEGAIEIRFQDNGLGIPAGRLEKIFAPFFTTKTKGTGLGLPIVQKIVDLHGGQIDVESELGKGTTFHITLPVASPFMYQLELQSVVSPEISEQRLQAAFRRPVSAWLNAPAQENSGSADNE